MSLAPGLLRPFREMTTEELRAACEHWDAEVERVDAVMRDLRKLAKAVRAVQGLGYIPREMRAAARVWLEQREVEAAALGEEARDEEGFSRE